jgi:hypothetical protein
MSAAVGVVKQTARKVLITANWKSNGTVSSITSLVNNTLNKIVYDPNKIGTLPSFTDRSAGTTSESSSAFGDELTAEQAHPALHSEPQLLWSRCLHGRGERGPAERPGDQMVDGRTLGTSFLFR